MDYDVEATYDEKISPLMEKIIDICKENDIQMLASFTLNEDGLMCSTYLDSKKYNEQKLEEAKKVIRRKPFIATAMIMNEE